MMNSSGYVVDESREVIHASGTGQGRSLDRPFSLQRLGSIER